MATPERTCVGCRRRRPADALVRWRLGDDRLPTTSPQAAGRGAWICADSPDCLETAIRRRGFDRAWKTSVPAPALDRLRTHEDRNAIDNESALPAPTTDMRQ